MFPLAVLAGLFYAAEQNQIRFVDDQTCDANPISANIRSIFLLRRSSQPFGCVVVKPAIAFICYLGGR
jgi:hypothetical protein